MYIKSGLIGGGKGGSIGSALVKQNFNNVFKKIYSLCMLYVIPRRLCNGLGQLKLKWGLRQLWGLGDKAGNDGIKSSATWQLLRCGCSS